MSTVVDEVPGLEAAAREVNALEAEQRALPSRLSEAAREADGERLLALRRRREEVEAELFTARARYLQLRIEDAERRRFEYKRAVSIQEGALLEAARDARAAADLAQAAVAAHGRVAFEMRRLENVAEIERQRANELRQELAALVREAGGEKVEQVINFGERTGRPLMTRAGR